MPDREKVIERLTGLKELLKFQKDILGYGSFIEDINDVLALLKEQEAVEPKLSMSGLWYECPICHRHLTKNSDNYCARCGKPVLWEGR